MCVRERKSQCPPTVAKSQPPCPWQGLSCVLLFLLGCSSCLGSASQPAQRHQPLCHLCHTCLRTEEGLINGINDSAHTWLDKTSCHVQYALLVPPDSAESFRCSTNPFPHLEWKQSHSHLTAQSVTPPSPLPLTLPSICQLTRAVSSQGSSPNPAWHGAWKEKSLVTSGKPFSQ